jgi:hypothetical protein
MSYVIAAPDMLGAAASDVAGISSSLSEANAAAAASTTKVIAAGCDEMSAAFASLFSSHAKAFQALSAQAAAFHSQFVQALHGGAGAYASTEAANAGPWQTLEQDLRNVVKAPTVALLGRPLIGNGGMGGVFGGSLGLLGSADPSLPVPNVAVSVGGFTLLRLGSATATSVTSDLAIALGPSSDASATGGFDAYAIGAQSTATAGPGNFDIANALGTAGSSSAGGPGNYDFATALGTDSTSDAGFGNLDAAIAVGPKMGAESALDNLDFSAALGNFGGANFAGAGALNGNNNLAVMIGTDSNANAGNIFAFPGNNNLAIVLGNNSNANAFDGNRNLAAALGNDLSASAMGGSMTRS